MNDLPGPPGIKELLECVEGAGEILRALTHLAEPLRAEPSKVPTIEPTIQDGCFSAICNRFKDLATILSKNDDTPLEPLEQGRPSRTPKIVIFLTRLLQFDLGLRGVWTNNTKSASNDLASTLFELAIVRHSHPHLFRLAVNIVPLPDAWLGTTSGYRLVSLARRYSLLSP